MSTEIVNKVEIIDSGDLFLRLQSGGKSSYQYIYREAAGVYWDNNLHGFKFPATGKMSNVESFEHTAESFEHILKVVESGLEVKLVLSDGTEWNNMREKDIEKILSNNNPKSEYELFH